MSTFAQFARPGRRQREDDDDGESDFSVSVDGATSPRSNTSKRPRLSAEAADGGVSEASEGALLPDSFRRSPQNQRHVTVNGLLSPVRDEDQPQVHQPGSIVRVQLTDFVTYTRAEFHPGPNLNMIIGPNGTGKSTLVCAICLGLGWGSSHLGRAKDVGEFVKHGSKKSEIQIELAADPERHFSNPVITTRITKEGNKTDYFIDAKKSTKKTVIELARSFSTQVDNLCQFLPQDRVVEFAALSPVDLLTQTQRAAAPEYMSEWHDELKTLRKDQKLRQTEQQTLMETLKHMTNKQKAQEADVMRLRERSELRERIVAMEKLRPFPEYREAKQKHSEANQRKKAAQREFRDLEKRVEPNLAAANEKEVYLIQVDEVVKRRRNLVERGEGAVKDVEKKIAGCEEKLQDITNEIESEKNSVKKTRTEIPKLRQEIQKIEKAMQTPPEQFDAAGFNEAIREKTRLTREAIEKIQELKDRVGSLDEQIRHRERIIQDREKEKDNLLSQVGQQASKLKRVSPDAAKIWDWIQQNRNKFQSEVFGPPIVECTLQNPRCAAAVETMIPDGDKLSFTVTSQQDMKMLLDQASKMRLHDINIRVSLQGMNTFQTPNVSTQQLQQLGLAGWLLELIDGPEPVLAMLCDNRSIHQMAYASREITEQQFDALKRSPITSWVTPSQSYVITRRREYGDAAVSTRVQALKQARFWTDAPVDRQMEQDIDVQLREAKGEIGELQESLKEVKAEGAQLTMDRKKLDKEKKEIEEEKAQKQRALSEFQGLGVKLQHWNEKLAQADEVIKGYKERVWQLTERAEEIQMEKGQQTLNLANAAEALRNLHLQLFEVEVMQIEAKSDLDQLKAQHAEEVKLLEERRNEVRLLVQETMRLLEAGKKLQEKCQDIGSEFSDVEREIYDQMDSEAWLSDRLETEVQSLQARLDMTHGGANSENIIRDFEARAKSIEDKNRKVNEMGSSLEDVQTKITELREKWEPELDALIEKISDAFRENFEQIQCVGEVGVYKDEEEFESWAIQIRVKFRCVPPLSNNGMLLLTT